MHKIIASLLLALAAAALLSSPEAASSRATHDNAYITIRATTASGLVDREDTVAVGDYIDMNLEEGLLLSVRLSALDAGEAAIDAIVARDGRTLAEPSLRVARDASATIALSAPPLTLQFEVH